VHDHSSLPLEIGAEKYGGSEYPLKRGNQAAILGTALLHAKNVEHLGGTAKSDVLLLLAHRQGSQKNRNQQKLLADVEVVATYELANINRARLENLIHTFFDAARLNIEIKDRFGNPVSPREWFLLPLPVIDDLICKIRSNEIFDYNYNPNSASLELL
jgi:hypothetical protein